MAGPQTIRWAALAATVIVAVAGVLTLRSPEPAPRVPAPQSGTPPITPPTAVAAETGTRTGTDDPAAAPDPGDSAPCNGCLHERAVLDVGGTFLYHWGETYLDIRAEVYADIPWLTPDRTSPPLPEGLVDAPDDYPRGPHLPYLVEAEAAETWVVWYQTGWMRHEILENRIETGALPPVAVSWPSLKIERYLLVNARTGEIDQGLPLVGRPRRDEDLSEEARLRQELAADRWRARLERMHNARCAAAARARHWRSGGNPAG